MSFFLRQNTKTDIIWTAPFVRIQIQILKLLKHNTNRIEHNEYISKITTMKITYWALSYILPTLRFKLNGGFSSLVCSNRYLSSFIFFVSFWFALWLNIFLTKCESTKSLLLLPVIDIVADQIVNKSWLALLQGFSPINPLGCVNRVAFSFWMKWHDGITGSIPCSCTDCITASVLPAQYCPV